jgi:hypothetical protein
MQALPSKECQCLPQVIDDSIGNTLCATSTLSPDIREQLGGKLGADKVSRGVDFSMQHFWTFLPRIWDVCRFEAQF